jgi:hypothetical protein
MVGARIFSGEVRRARAAAMAGNQHDGVVQLFREHPELAAKLLERLLGVTVPEHVRSTVTESVLGKLAPPPLTADLVIELVDAEGRPQLVTIIEVQGKEDPDKLLSWPTYQTLARYSRRCDACVVVVTWDDDVEAWASRPIRLGPGNDGFRVHVLGPRRFPPIVDPAAVAVDPTLAVLTYMAHGNEAGGIEVLYATPRSQDSCRPHR